MVRLLKERIVIVCIGFVLFGLFPLVLFRMLAFPRASAELKQGVQRNLEGIVNKQKDILSLLWDERKSHARAISDTIQSELIIHGDEDFMSLVNVKNEHGYLRLKTQMECIKADYGYKGIFICDGAGVIQTTTENEKSLSALNIAKERFADNFQETLRDGKTSISNIAHFSLHDGHTVNENGVPSLFMSYPIRGNNRDVIGVVVLWMDTSVFTKAMRSVALGKTGEAYLVNKDGIMITKPRFADHSKNAGDTCKTCHRVTDPDTNLLTKGVTRCIATQADGYDLEGYRDYSGLTVVGGWSWQKDLNMGLIVEIDTDEALGAVNNIGSMVKSLMLVTIIPAFVMPMVMYRKLNTGYAFRGLSLPQKTLLGMTTVMMIGVILAITDGYELSKNRGYIREQRYKVHNPLHIFGSIVTKRDEDFIKNNISKFKEDFRISKSGNAIQSGNDVKDGAKQSVEKTTVTWELKP